MSKHQQQLRHSLFVGVCAVLVGVGYLAYWLVNQPAAEQVQLTPEQAITLAVNDIQPTSTGVELHNPLHTAYFMEDGLTFKSAQGPSWQWELNSISAKGIIPGAVPAQQVSPTTIAYPRGGVTEQYVIRSEHIEQQFILPEPLTLTETDLQISGRITSNGAFVTADDGWMWTTDNGVVSLGDVTVFDANGQLLPATLEVTADSTVISVDGLSLASAAYPVTIDPLIGTNSFTVSANNLAKSFNPAVAYNNSTQDFLVVWTDRTNSDPTGQTEIYGQLVNADGSLSGSNFQISTAATTAVADRPDVVYNSASNEYFVVWQQVGAGTGEVTVNSQRLNSAGAAQGANTEVSANADADSYLPAVAANTTDNQYLVVWQAQTAGNTNDLVGQVLDNAGAPAGGLITFAQSGTIATQPDVAYNSTSNEYFVVWSDGPFNADGYEIYGQRAAANGTLPAGAVILSNMGFNATHPAVAYSVTSNNFLVVWAGENGTDDQTEIYGQLVAAGAPSGGAITISSGEGNYPAVGYNSNANAYLVSWLLSDNANSQTIYEWLNTDGTTNGSDSVTFSAFSSSASRPANAYGISEGLISWRNSANEIVAELVSLNVSDCTPLNESDLALTLTESSDPVLAGDVNSSFSYALAIQNNGPNIACGVSVSTNLTLPSGVSVLSSAPSAGTSYNGTTWTIGDMNPGALAFLTIVLDVSSSASAGTDALQLSAAASATTNLTNTGDDTDAETTSIVTNNFSINDVAITEGNSGQQLLTFTVNRTSNVSASSVDFVTVNGTATAGSDYTAVNQTVNFPAGGGNSQTVDVLITGDTTVELTETFTAQLQTPVNGSITDGQGQATITNDDSATLTISNNSITEGNTGQASLVFAVQLSNNVDVPFTVSYNTADGTATVASSDYLSKTGSLSFAGSAGENQFIMIDVYGDTVVEADETFTVNLTNLNVSGRDVTATATSVTGTITNDDTATVDFARNSVSVTEGNTSRNVVVRLTGTSDLTIEVDYALSDNTASAGSDYTAASGTLTFPPGTNRQTISVAILDDAVGEDDEIVTVTLSNPVNVTIGTAKNPSSVVIVDNDGGPTINFSSFDFNVNESASTVEISTTVNPPPTQTVTVDYSIQNNGFDTADIFQDVLLQALDNQTINNPVASGTLTFTTGITLQTFTIPIVSDSLFEANETFSLVLSNPTNANLGLVSETTITIENDDEPPRVSFVGADVAVDENVGVLQLPLSLNTVSGQDTTIFYQVLADTAQAGSDFVSPANSVIIPTGGLTTTIPITIVDDSLYELTETFTVTLNGADGAVLLDSAQSITILNDDPLITPTVSITDAAVAEGESGSTLLTFPIELSVPGLNPVVLGYASADGTATVGEDYQAISTTVEIPAGETNATISVVVLGDITQESNETVQVTLTSVTNAEIGTGTATGTILNDDDINLPTIDIGDVETTEGDANKSFTFPLTLDVPAPLPVEVTYRTVAGTASAAVDFELITSTVTIPFNATTGSIDVTVFGDQEIEPEEMFTIVIDSITNGSIGRGSATATIFNDDTDTQPLANIGNVTVSEESTNIVASFPVTLNFAITSSVTIDYNTADGTAIAGQDYVDTSGSITIPAGFTTGVIDIVVLSDNLIESNEGFIVTLSGATNARISDSIGIATILSDGQGIYLPLVLSNASADPLQTIQIRSGP